MNDKIQKVAAVFTSEILQVAAVDSSSNIQEEELLSEITLLCYFIIFRAVFPYFVYFVQILMITQTRSSMKTRRCLYLDVRPCCNTWPAYTLTLNHRALPGSICLPPSCLLIRGWDSHLPPHHHTRHTYPPNPVQ